MYLDIDYNIFHFVADPPPLDMAAIIDSGLQNDQKRTADAQNARPQDTPQKSSRRTRPRSRGGFQVWPCFVHDMAKNLVK